MVAAAVHGYETVRNDDNATLTADVTTILGHEPRTFRTWIRDHRAEF